MASLQQRLQIIIDAQNKTGGAFSDISKDLNKFKSNVESWQPAFKKMQVAGAVAFTAIAGAVALSVKSAGEAEVQMAKFDTTLKNLVGTSLKVKTGMVNTVSTLKLTKEETEAVNIAIKEQELKLTKLNKAYKAGDLSAKEYKLAVEKANNQIAQYNIKLDETNKTQTEVTRTIKLTADEVDKARVKFLEASKAVGKLGFDDEEASVAMAKFYQATGDANKAIELNALAMDLARARGIDFATATGLVGQVLAGNGKVLKQYQIDIEDTATPLEALGILHDKVKGQAVAFADTYEGKMQALGQTIGNVREAIGKPFLDVIKKLIDAMTPTLEKIGEWIEKNPELTQKIILVTAGIAGLVAILGTIGVILPAVITGVTLLATGVTALAGAFAVLTAPVWIVIGIITALIAVGVLLYKHWDEVKAFAIASWQAIADFFVGIWEGIKSFLETTMYFIVGLFVMMMDLIFPGWQEGLQKIKDFFVMIWEGIKVYFTGVVASMKVIFESLKNVFKTVWDGIVAVFNWAKGEMGKVFNWINSAIEPLFKMIDKLQQKLSAIGGAVKSAFGSVVQKGKDFFAGRAIGGPVSSGVPYMVGENGPEIFTPSTAGRILSNGSGRGSIVINVTGNSFMGREGIAEQIGNELVKALQMRMKMSY